MNVVEPTTRVKSQQKLPYLSELNFIYKTQRKCELTRDTGYEPSSNYGVQSWH